MAKLGDRVKETSATTGTGTLDLAGAPTGFRGFGDEFTSGQTEIPYLCVDDPDSPTDYEYGYGTFTSGTPDTFSRDTVTGSSNSGSKVSWTAGCTIVCTPNADWANTIGGMLKTLAKTGAYTVTVNDRGKLINATSGTWTLSLPAAATAKDGFWFAFTNSGTGVITIDGNSSETIDGGSSINLQQNGGFLVVCDGSNWNTVGLVRPGIGLSVSGGKIAIDAAYMRGYIAGLGLTNNATDSNNDIDVSAGVCASDANAYLLSTSGLTKRLDAAWAVGTNQGGLDTGTKANSTWYHVWLIARSDTGVVDALFSTSATSPTMPTNYDHKRRIGSVRTDSSGNILAFYQDGDVFKWIAGIVERSSTAAQGLTSFALTVPTGVVVRPIFLQSQTQGTAGGATTSYGDAQASSPLTEVTVTNAASENSRAIINGVFLTDTSAQLQFKVVISSGTLSGNTTTNYGWIDSRGRFQ